MEIDYKKILTGLLSKAYKLDDGKVAELLEKTDGTDIDITDAILELDKARIGDYGKGKFQDGYKKAKGESLFEFEKAVKEQYSITDDVQGVELIAAVVTAEVNKVQGGGAGKGKAGEITEDEIKKHPLYINLENQMRTKVETTEAAWKAKLDEREAQYAGEQTFAAVREASLNLLNGGGFVLPDDAAIAQNQKNWLIQTLQGYKYEKTDAGLVPIKDGKRIEDAHGHAVTLEQFIQEQARALFPVKQNNGGANGGAAGGDAGGAGGGKAPITKPKTLDELSAILNNQEIPLAERMAIGEEFNNSAG